MDSFSSQTGLTAGAHGQSDDTDPKTDDWVPTISEARGHITAMQI